MNWTSISRIFALAFLLVACGGQGSGVPPASPRSSPDGAQNATAMDAAARSIVASLRGGAPLADSLLADTVTLYVAPEGGGAISSYTREQLSSSASWQVVVGNRRVPLTPPPTSTKLTSKPGVHFNCHETTLHSRYPGLASLPHVGTKLEPDSAATCLQSWNLTLVFDSTGSRIVAAVYDQWEW